MVLPPGPTLSAEEQTFEWFARPYAFLRHCAKHHGDPFTLDFKGLGKHIFFSSPKAIQEIFGGDPDVMLAGEGNAVIRPFLGTMSLLQLDGAPYTRHRKMMLPAFHPKQIAGFAESMREVANETLDGWTVGGTFSVHTAMLDVSLEIILHAVFGTRDPRRHDRMKALMVTLLDAVNFSTYIHPDETGTAGRAAWDRFLTRKQALDVELMAEIEDNRRQPHPNCVLGLLVQAKDDAGVGMSDGELRDELMTLLIAGHETTATALSWAFYWLLRPEGKSLTPLLAELQTDGNWLELPYLDAVVKETLRIHPVIPIVSRKLARPARIADLDLPEGAHVVPCIYLTHHRKEIYPKPDSFLPERFLEKRFTPFEYLPFGGGIRRCLGMGFGQAEMKIVLATVLKRYRLKLEEGAIVRPVRRSVVIGPSGGTRVTVLERL